MSDEKSPELVRARNIWKQYRGNWALQGAYLTLREGSIHALIGPNGAGKSTLFGVISGEHAFDRGDLDVLGLKGRMRPPKLIRSGLARSFQVARIFNEMDVRANVRIAVAAGTKERHLWWKASFSGACVGHADELICEMGLKNVERLSGGVLSQGDRKRLEIAMALASKPRLLLLDEPTAGMSQEETERTAELLLQLRSERGMTLLICEHDMPFVFKLADEVTVLHKGKILCTGKPDTVRQNDDVRRAYLGEMG